MKYVAKSLEQLVDSGAKFGTIYADPPWQYSNKATRSSAAKNYPTLSIHDLAALPIKELAADNSHLHLWATSPLLPDALVVMAAWGFEYKSSFVWIKNRFGMGNYWRVSHELMLLGVRGNCKFRSKKLNSWLMADSGEHSAKPEKTRLLIERSSPSPRLELFARQAVDGWTVWGNDIREDLFYGRRDVQQCSDDEQPGSGDDRKELLFGEASD